MATIHAADGTGNQVSSGGHYDTQTLLLSLGGSLLTAVAALAALALF